MTSFDLRAVCVFSVERNSIHLWKRNSFTYIGVIQQQQSRSSEIMEFGSSSGNVLFTERFCCLSSEHGNCMACQACIRRVIPWQLRYSQLGHKWCILLYTVCFAYMCGEHIRTFCNLGIWAISFLQIFRRQ